MLASFEHLSYTLSYPNKGDYIMKLSESTLSILKNFSTFNSSIILNEGKMQKTMSPDKKLLAQVELEDHIPNKFPIYDLNQFLGNVSALPDLTFNGDTMLMSDGEVTMAYKACSAEVVISPPDKNKLVIENPDAIFDISQSIVSKLIRLAAMNSLPNISVIGKNGKMIVQVHEKKNDKSNHAETVIGQHSGPDFNATFETEKLKMIPDDYKVEVKNNAFAKFTSKNRNLTYFVALEVI